ncbi:ferredoxin [Nocardia sp. NPDC127579]|uniref:ferredoxin n=1 Tax=Nocardia sp. NPDC127579 TaxID=3345402 RepID=UPI003643714E
MRIAVDRSRCEGHGMCEALAPLLFQVGDDGITVPATAEVGAGDRQLLDLVVDSCPTRALRFE